MMINQELLDFIEYSPTQFQAIRSAADLLLEGGAAQLAESDFWVLEPGRSYFTVRNGSSLIAWRMPGDTDFSGYMIAAAHSDSPYLKIKENAETVENGYVRLSAERYGGMLLSSWLDRPLSAAGRVAVRTEKGLEMRLVDLKEPIAIIPNLAPHMDRERNNHPEYNVAVDLQPLYGDEDTAAGTLRGKVAEAAGVTEEELLSTELYLYNPQKGAQWGDYISSPRLDDLQCAFSGVKGFLASSPSQAVPVLCIFDNEEVGSGTRQGADSAFLSGVLDRIALALDLNAEEQAGKMACSFMVSADNAHAVHPNHPEYRDPNHPVYMNKGIVIKYSASQSYASDAFSASVFRLVCERSGVPCQIFANRADLRGGSTLGPISSAHVSVPTVDIGLAQLAMHSCYETAGKKDTEYMVRAMETYFSSALFRNGDRIDLIEGLAKEDPDMV